MEIFQPSGMEIESLTGNYLGIHKQTTGAGLTTKSDRLIRSFNYDLELIVIIDLLADTPVAFCSTVHNRAGLITVTVLPDRFLLLLVF